MAEQPKQLPYQHVPYELAAAVAKMGEMEDYDKVRGWPWWNLWSPAMRVIQLQAVERVLGVLTKPIEPGVPLPNTLDSDINVEMYTLREPSADTLGFIQRLVKDEIARLMLQHETTQHIANIDQEQEPE